MEIEIRNIIIQKEIWTADAFTDSGLFVCTITLPLSEVNDDKLLEIKTDLLGRLNG